MIAVTGATGHLGRLAIQSLMSRGVPSREIVAAVRSPGKAADLTERGGGGGLRRCVVRSGASRSTPALSAEEEAVRSAFAAELERVCPRDEWTEPPFGFGLPRGLEHAVAVLRTLPDHAGVHAFLRALDQSTASR